VSRELHILQCILNMSFVCASEEGTMVDAILIKSIYLDLRSTFPRITMRIVEEVITVSKTGWKVASEMALTIVVFYRAYRRTPE